MMNNRQTPPSFDYQYIQWVLSYLKFAVTYDVVDKLNVVRYSLCHNC